MFLRTLILFALVLSARAGGLLARFQQGGKTDLLALPNAAFFVPAGQAATRFLAPGACAAELAGAVSVELRAQYSFQIECSGRADLFVNGQPVIAGAPPGLSDLSRPVRLAKGTNSLLVKIQGRAGQDLSFRLFWKSRSVARPVPIPSAALTFDESDPSLRAQTELRLGAAAYREFLCFKCHGDGPSAAEPGAPDLSAAGARLAREWLAGWIAAPDKLRADARMPRLVSSEDAAMIADYLSTLGEPALARTQGDPHAGEKLFADLQCAACHGGETGQVSLQQASAKYRGAALERFLLDPQAGDPWSRMPNFKLAETEAANLSAFLGARPDPAAPVAHDTRRGRELFETSGCLNCHPGSGRNRAQLRKIARPRAGCLDPADSATPRFPLDDRTRAALAGFLEKAADAPPGPETPMEFALRGTAALRCAACHDAGDGAIRLEALGGKLRPEWSRRFIAGQVESKPRPWLAARMPAFPAYASGLAEGLAALHGLPPRTPDEGPVDPALAQAGAQLVSAAGGFACVACHAVGPAGAAAIVESPGVNLAYSGGRLLESFFHRWVLNPLALDPATKMPVYFDESGRSQLLDFFGGDGRKQIDAIWQYLRLGEKMPPPPAP